MVMSAAKQSGNINEAIEWMSNRDNQVSKHIQMKRMEDSRFINIQQQFFHWQM